MALPPESIKIGSRLYTVHTDDAAYLKMVEVQGKDNEAYTHHPSETMILRPGRTPNWTADSLLHETLHGVFGFNGVELSNVVGKIDDDNIEEYLVTVLSPILLMVLKDNPELVAFLVEPEVPWEADPSSPPAASPGE